MISFFSLASLSVRKEMKKTAMIKSHNTTLKNKTVQYDDFGDTFGKSRQNMHWDEIDTILSDFLQNPVTE